jgi:uncharacterized protein (TIGR03435 family)
MFAAALLGATAAALLGQAPAQQLSFDVASVKINRSADANPKQEFPGSGTLKFTDTTLEACIRWAYDVRDFQIGGAPNWLNTDRYDIFAKAAPDTGTPQLRLMLQALLAERFKLQLRRETKALTVNSLVVGKGGPKLKKSTSEGSSISPGLNSITARGATMAMFANQLSTTLNRVVVDKTGLTGKYDFKLEWVGEIESSTGSGPSALTAIQTQLGLKLEQGKGDVEVLVIDHVERIPTEN